MNHETWEGVRAEEEKQKVRSEEESTAQYSFVPPRVPGASESEQQQPIKIVLTPNFNSSFPLMCMIETSLTVANQ